MDYLFRYFFFIYSICFAKSSFRQFFFLLSTHSSNFTNQMVYLNFRVRCFCFCFKSVDSSKNKNFIKPRIYFRPFVYFKFLLMVFIVRLSLTHSCGFFCVAIFPFTSSPMLFPSVFVLVKLQASYVIAATCFPKWEKKKQKQKLFLF